MNDYLYNKQGEDPEVAQLEELLGGYEHTAELRKPLPERRRGRAALYVVLAAAAAVAVALAWPRGESSQPVIADGDPPPPASRCVAGGDGFAFASQNGGVTCDGAAAESGVLPVDTWLETGADGSANLEIADIGSLTIFGDSRLRLVGTGQDEHRLELARGKVSAEVLAPPRLFVVDTPAATAVDLGCAYDLSVDEHDVTHLRVTSGAVSLERGERLVWVPAGSEVSARPGQGPGVPVSIDADAELRAAATKLEGGDASALPTLLARADDDDVGTLWNLLSRTEDEQRGLVAARLQELRPRPSSVAEQAVLAGEPRALEAWRDELESALFE